MDGWMIIERRVDGWMKGKGGGREGGSEKGEESVVVVVVKR